MSRRKTETHHSKCTISNGLDISRVVSVVSRQPYIEEKQQIGPLSSWFRYIHHFLLLSLSSSSSSTSPSQTIYARTSTLGQNAVETEKQKNSNQMMKVVSLPRWYGITFSFVHFRSAAMNRWKRRDAINLEEDKGPNQPFRLSSFQIFAGEYIYSNGLLRSYRRLATPFPLFSRIQFASLADVTFTLPIWTWWCGVEKENDFTNVLQTTQLYILPVGTFCMIYRFSYRQRTPRTKRDESPYIHASNTSLADFELRTYATTHAHPYTHEHRHTKLVDTGYTGHVRTSNV